MLGGKGEHRRHTGQLVWPSTNEFKKGAWDNVPPPVGPNERRTAYVFIAGSDPTAAFVLPSASQQIHEDSPGDLGYGFTTSAFPGNHALYALAGIENDAVSPPMFTAYVMGVVRGVPVLPERERGRRHHPDEEDARSRAHHERLAADSGPQGPDHLHATVSVMLGNDGFALLPIGTKDPLLPVQGDLAFVGVPNLDGDLGGSTFYATATAATGPTNTAPMSVIGHFLQQHQPGAPRNSSRLGN